jgi:uncharacterized protein (TIGR04255 family)
MESKFPVKTPSEFPLLAKAPIVEAVVDIRVACEVKWEELWLRDILQKKLPEYSKIETLRQSKYQVSVKKGQAAQAVCEDAGSVGLRLHDSTGHHIVQFNAGAFVFSRLKPYEKWGQFSGEALRLWGLYSELLKPKVVQRVGLRYVNRLPFSLEANRLDDFYKVPPEIPSDLRWSLKGFLHHDVYQVPDTFYQVNLIKTQVPPTASDATSGLILDIDVFIQEAFECTNDAIIGHLKEMRQIKNEAFFRNLTDNMIEVLKKKD